MHIIALPIINPDMVPNMNGCGSYGIHIDFSKLHMSEFDDCCNCHDNCYETCNVKKSYCDDVFENCLKNNCIKWSIERKWDYVQNLGMIKINVYSLFMQKLIVSHSFINSSLQGNCIVYA